MREIFRKGANVAASANPETPYKSSNSFGTWFAPLRVMTFLRLLPAALSILLLAVHFLRSDNEILVVATSLSLFMLLVRRGWSRRLLQVMLLAAAAEWLRVLVELVSERRLYNMPYARLAVIIGSVVAVAAVAAAILSTKRVITYFSEKQTV